MADFSEEDFDIALTQILISLSCGGFHFELKKEQKEALRQLVFSGDLIAILPTGFGKSLIFQLLVRVKEIITKKSCCVIVVCPLKSIIQDQLAEATSLGLRAGAISDVSVDDEELSSYQLLFGSAEEVLQKKFLDVLKQSFTFFFLDWSCILEAGCSIQEVIELTQISYFSSTWVTTSLGICVISYELDSNTFTNISEDNPQRILSFRRPEEIFRRQITLFSWLIRNSELHFKTTITKSTIFARSTCRHIFTNPKYFYLTRVHVCLYRK